MSEWDLATTLNRGADRMGFAGTGIFVKKIVQNVEAISVTDIGFSIADYMKPIELPTRVGEDTVLKITEYYQDKHGDIPPLSDARQQLFFRM